MANLNEKLALLSQTNPDEKYLKYRSFEESQKLSSTYEIGTNRYDYDNLNEDGAYEKPKLDVKGKLRKSLKCNPLTILYSLIPVLEWLPKYEWKKNISYDILSGITVAIMHIPQGMAYGLLGNVPAITGLYMAFFPVLIYFVFGTSRHVSIGTFAIVCLMTGKVVNSYGIPDEEDLISASANHTMMATDSIYTKTEVAVTVTFCVAILQFVMYVFRLGVIANLLSDVLVSGFTCACAFHVVSSQLKDLLGISVTKRQGLFSMLLTIYDAVMELPNCNNNAVLISFVVIVLSIINNEILKPRLATRTKVPFPIELVAVVLGTATSYLMDFKSNYNVTVIGEIPTGLPNMTIPRFELIPSIISDAVIITIVSYAITISMALIFAQKLQYDVNANQELFALGCANIGGSFSGAMPVAASLSRSMIQQTVGGTSQLASVVSCLFILIILVWVGPLFQFLPRSVLASIIVVALKGMLKQCEKLPVYFRMDKWDGIIWLFTFLVTAVFSITMGLASSIILSIVLLFYKGQHSQSSILGNLSGTDFYLDIKRYQAVTEIPGMKILRYCGSLNFSTKTSFKGTVFKAVGYNSKAPKAAKKRNGDENDVVANGREEGNSLLAIKYLILDCTALTYIDPAGVEQMKIVVDALRKTGIEVFMVGCSGPVYEMIKTCDKYQDKESSYIMFPTIATAVTFAKAHSSS
ncbi:PREDICTED: solute carrier family 26 member 10-like isoform X1 [Nicrophorus vespilloides]|uniref:Solute carrier family 26 member 10-like isoform X1 n=1 Tax=Nicrophorus vespilloides TaxID=110193 RepID=A0ABM1MXD3_NICVS|nr:PREDICTED: solute carrier family 26 member 10-like isoform X1 [Nicrophorus vespilloides]